MRSLQLSSLNWEPDDDDFMTARSIYHDAGSSLFYRIHFEGDEWSAIFEGVELFKGSLSACIDACEQSEMEAMAKELAPCSVLPGEVCKKMSLGEAVSTIAKVRMSLLCDESHDCDDMDLESAMFFRALASLEVAANDLRIYQAAMVRAREAKPCPA